MTLFLLSCRPHYTIHHSPDLYAVKAEGAADSLSSIALYLKPLRDSLNQSMGEVIGVATSEFKKEKGGGSLGSLVIEAMNAELQHTKPHVWADSTGSLPIVLTNPGGLRIGQISKGDITLEKIFELLPFENELTLIEVNGKTLKQLAKLMQDNGGWPNNAGLTPDSLNEMKAATVIMDIMNREEKMVVQLNRSKIVDEKKYRILTNDYVAGGGDNCIFLKTCPRILTGITLRDALLHYIRKQHTISPK